jgi:hypothetical protein
VNNFLQWALMAVQAVVAAKAAPPRARPWCLITGAVSVGFCLLIAAGFLLAAAWLVLVPLIGALNTALVIAGLALFTASLIMLFLRYGQPSSPVAAPTSLLDSVPLAELGQMFNGNKASILLAALLAGVIAGSTKTER